MLKNIFIVGVILAAIVAATTATDIPKVDIYEINHRINNPPKRYGFKVKWRPIENKNVTDPIIGVKVKVWRVPCEIKTTDLHLENGTVMRIVKSERLIFTDKTISQELPEQVYIVPPDALEVTVPHIDAEVWFDVRALAFTSTQEGPYTAPNQMKTLTNDPEDIKKSCEKIISQTPIEEEELIDYNGEGEINNNDYNDYNE